jgi:hypothetical protein|tara:strand:- start:791 stop:937 length:147 start_codon:yes stop_codon:yes gene_type:complete
MKSRGFGDTVAKFTEVTGIKKAVSVVFKECNCSKRQKALNIKFPYKNE